MDLEAILKQYWGYDSFRPGQRPVIEDAVAGRDTLALMPTGGGKSIVFQVAGLARGGLTLVVTPLVALMKDQVDNLSKNGIQAVFLHSSMSRREYENVWQKLARDKCRFLYVSPERLRSERFVEDLRLLKRVNLLVADEAHCISQWGYDFRPSYLEVGRLRRFFPDIPVLALTASATPAVAEDICRLLKMRDGRRHSTSFARPNISYVVRATDNMIKQAVHILNRVSGTAIVYVRSRKATSEIADMLNSYGIRASAFHAGLTFEIKERLIAGWKDGSIRVMVATNAFGMGIDKADVRIVLHYGPAPTLEEYYQEAGRAGRDGKQAYAVVLYDPARHIKQLHARLTATFPPRDYIKELYQLICNYIGVALEEGEDRLFEFDVDGFCTTFRQYPQRVLSALNILGASGLMEYVDERENASRVQICATRDELYSLTPAVHPHAEVVMRALLRRYPGLFSDYISISETRLCDDTGLGNEEVYEALKSVSRAGFIHYVPRKRVSYVYLPSRREYPEDVKIPCAVYEDRREIMKKRLEKVEQYLSVSGECRARLISEYFGQDTENCGTCDNCRAARHKSGSAPHARNEESLLNGCLRLIQTRGTVSQEEFNRCFPASRQQLNDILRYLIDNGAVGIDRVGNYIIK